MVKRLKKKFSVEENQVPVIDLVEEAQAPVEPVQASVNSVPKNEVIPLKIQFLKMHLHRRLLKIYPLENH